MARRKSRGKRTEPRWRLVSPSGQSFTIVDRGTRGWQIEFTQPRGERVRERLGHCDRATAETQAHEVVERAVRRRQAEDSGSPTLIRVASEMIAAKLKAGKAASYTTHMEGHLANYVLPELGPDTLVAEVTAADLLGLKKLLADGDLDPNTCNRILTTLRQVFKYAEDPGGYTIAPPLPRNFPTASWEAAERWQTLSPPEIAELLSAAPPEVAPILTYVANTGLRIGTALQTEREWVNLDRGTVIYPASVMKGRRPHTVDLNAPATRALEAALASSDGRPYPFSYWFVLKRWVALRDAAERPGLRLHDLRHSFVSNQLAAGAPIHVVRDLAAHRHLATTALYAHSTDEARRAAMKRVEVQVTGLDAAAFRRARDTGRDTGGGNTSGRKRKSPGKTEACAVPRAGIEPATRGFSIPCSTN